MPEGSRVPVEWLKAGDLSEESQRRVHAFSRELAGSSLTFQPWTGRCTLLQDAAVAMEQPNVKALVMQGDRVTVEPEASALLKATAVVTGTWVVLLASDRGANRYVRRLGEALT